MAVVPYSPGWTPRRPPLGLVRDDLNVIMETGGWCSLAAAPAEARLFADRAIGHRHLHHGLGLGIRFNQVLVRWEVGETSVRLLPSHPGDGSEVLEGLVRLRDALGALGASLGSPAATAQSLARATIDRPLKLDVDPPDVREVIGGRQELFVPRGTFVEAFESWDLPAAYAATIGAMRYGGRWREVRGLPRTDEHPCIVSASVRVPDITGPLPRRARTARPHGPWAYLFEQTRSYPTGRVVRGLWSAPEVRAAQAAGCRVKVRRVWIATGDRAPFEQWWTEIRRLRRLPGYAGTLAKIVGNAFWGSFNMTGERTVVRYVEGRPVRIGRPEASRAFWRAPALADWIAGTTRARLYADVIAPHGERLIAVHTDGALVLPGADRPKGWRTKDSGTHLIIHDPNHYRYTSLTGGIVYKLAGVPERAKAQVWASTYANRTAREPWVPERYDLFEGMVTV